MKSKIIEIILKLSEFDEDWEENIKLLNKKVTHVHPDLSENRKSTPSIAAK